MEASHDFKFQLVALGCETAESAAVGAISKINDLDAIDAFLRALAMKDVTTTFGALLSALSGPNIQIAIDPSRLGETDRVPLELLGSDKQVSNAGYAVPNVGAAPNRVYAVPMMCIPGTPNCHTPLGSVYPGTGRVNKLPEPHD